MTEPFTIRPLEDADRTWVGEATAAEWGSREVFVHGERYLPEELDGFLAEGSGAGGALGLLTFRVQAGALEIVTLNSYRPSRGVGRALMERAREEAKARGCRRVWLVTTNDNLGAVRFYQKLGYRLVAIGLDEVTRSRELKPEIPERGLDDIPIRDEWELELVLDP